MLVQSKLQMAAGQNGGPSARSGDAGSADSLIDRLKEQNLLESAMESLEKPMFRHQRSHSASDLLESTSKSQFDGAASTDNSSASVFSAKQLDKERKDKLYPIPPRRTKKMKIRSRSSSATTALEQVESQSTDKKVAPAVFKRPLAEQRSNPELTRKVKPPRPPPPNRQVPPRTYVHPNSKAKQAERDTKDDHHSIVIDSRAQRRQRHARLPQPERPPLPYETFVLQKQLSHINSKRHNADHINSSVVAMKGPQEESQVRVLVTLPPPSEYEEVVCRTAAASLRKSSVSDNIPIHELSTSSHLFPGPVRGREMITGGGGNDHDKAENLANRMNEHRESVAVPYEVPSTKSQGKVATADEINVKDSATVPSSEAKQKLQKTGKCNLEDSGQYAYIRNCSIGGWWNKQEDSSEVDVGSEPTYIEMNPAVYIPPPKDYKPKKRPKEARIKR